jgi:hypothetical protein
MPMSQTQPAEETLKHAAHNGLLTTTTTRPLSADEFVCAGCNTLHKMAPYAIAQRAMGHRLVFTCPLCDHNTTR